MTSFVAGATGYVGREVVRQMCERRGKVWAHVRPGSPSAERAAARFGSWGADIVEQPWQLDPMARLLAELAPDVVFCCIGTTRASARRDKLGADDIYQAVDVDLTSLLVEAVVTAGIQPRLVYLSSIGADEKRRSRYLAARGRAEAAVTASGLPYVIARPSFIAGSGRDDPRPLERIAAKMSDGFVNVAGLFGARRLRDRLHSMDNVTLASALVEAAVDPAVANQVLAGDRLQTLAHRARCEAPIRSS